MHNRAKRIAVLGPECSGKTTLCADLAGYWDAHVVDEYARGYLSGRPGYVMEDLIHIAEEQFRLNQPKTDRLLICDTEMSTIAIWAQERFGSVPEAILTWEEAQDFDYYLLCRPDMPWEADPLRESPSDRERLFKAYSARLDKLGRAYLVVKGARVTRQRQVAELLS